MSKTNPPIDSSPEVLLVHCVDTEGPLSEDLEATFERLRKEKGIQLAPSAATLVHLQQGAIALGGREAEIADFVHPKRLAYLEDWPAVMGAIRDVTSAEFRHRHADGLGRPYRFSWFIIDVIGYANNPRRKAAGHHAIWDQYSEIVRSPEAADDAVGWHFHTVPVGGSAIEYNACWTNNDWHERSVAMRLLDKRFFPAIFRAGGHIERNDTSHWLEMFIPFDFSCRSFDPVLSGKDYPAGAINDWRGARCDWAPFHPDWYDYRREGGMRRWIFRTLDIDSNACCVTEAEVEKAFDRVARGTTTILAYSNHDRRHMGPEIEGAMAKIRAVAARHPQVRWRHANAWEAARVVVAPHVGPPLGLEIERRPWGAAIRSSRPLFGPAPFLAVEEAGGMVYRDNVTREGECEWAYRPVRPNALRRFGVGASAPDGETAATVIDWGR